MRLRGYKAAVYIRSFGMMCARPVRTIIIITTRSDKCRVFGWRVRRNRMTLARRRWEINEICRKTISIRTKRLRASFDTKFSFTVYRVHPLDLSFWIRFIIDQIIIFPRPTHRPILLWRNTDECFIKRNTYNITIDKNTIIESPRLEKEYSFHCEQVLCLIV